MRWTRSAKIPVGAVEARAGVRQEVDTVLTLKRPSSLTAAEQEALQEVRNHIPELATAYDFKEAFYRIYDDPDKGSAMRAFEAWENVLPTKEWRGSRRWRRPSTTTTRTSLPTGIPLSRSPMPTPRA